MRSALWPDCPDLHTTDIVAFFAGSAVDILETLVAERPNDKLAGFIVLNLRSVAEGSRSTQVPYVEAWYIDPDFRGKGIGRSLIKGAEKWSLAKGFHELASDAEIENQDSIAAHKALGFKEVDRIVCFLKKLG